MTIRPGAGFGLEELAAYLIEHSTLPSGQEPPPLPPEAFVSMEIEWGERVRLLDAADAASRPSGTQTNATNNSDDGSGKTQRVAEDNGQGVGHDRILALTDGCVLGGLQAPDRFVLHWEFWLQLRQVLSGMGISFGDVVTAEQAEAAAGALERMTSDESGRIHLYLWGDPEGHVVNALSQFLRAGGLKVVAP